LSGIVEYINQSQCTYKIKVLSFCKDFSNNYDYFKNILDKIKTQNIKYEIKTDFENVDNFLDEISDLDIAVNMRYHGSLLSVVYGIPSINIIYDIHPHYSNKMNYLAKIFDLQKFFINYSELNKLKIKNLLILLNKEKNIKNRLIKKCDLIKNKSQKEYFKILSKI